MTLAAHLDPATLAFYQGAMRALRTAGARYLVGGAYAFAAYTGIHRHSKDFDIFCLEQELETLVEALRGKGYRIDRKFPHWLVKAHNESTGDFVDVIYSSGNGVAVVDEAWFEHSVASEVLGESVRLIPAEEMIWSKGFIMERERYDGADVAHVLHAR